MKLSEEEKYQLVERYQNGEAVSVICFQAGISKSTFYTWLKPYKVIKSNAGYIVSSNEFIKMKQRIVKLEQKIEVLQKVNSGVRKSYFFIFAHQNLSFCFKCNIEKINI